MELSTLDVKKCDGLEEVVLQQDVGLKPLLRIPGWMKMLSEDVLSPVVGVGGICLPLHPVSH